jgi:signal transduction histidine kinase
MKEFAHPGKVEMAMVDLNHAIESTLIVARNEFKYMADLVLQLDPELPNVPCLLNEFNQVILNLVVNAAQAIAETLTPADTGKLQPKGTITVATQRQGEWVQISISDTGCGIPENIQSKIFDPFFTTKVVGKGTGQGLAISRSIIVEKHQGRIEVTSKLGQGTTFFIHLPLVMAKAVAEV